MKSGRLSKPIDLLTPLDPPTVFVCDDQGFAALSDRKDSGELLILGYARKLGTWTVTVSYDVRPYVPVDLSTIVPGASRSPGGRSYSQPQDRDQIQPEQLGLDLSPMP